MHSLIGCVCICATGSINNIQSRSIPYLLFFSFLNHFCQISSSAACFLFYWRGWGPMENTKKFSFYLLLSPFSEFWLFLGILAFFPWIWLCVEFQTFVNSDFFLGILIFLGGILTFFLEFDFVWNSTFLWILTFLLDFWLFVNSDFFLGILIFWGGILTFTWDFWLFRNFDIFLRIRTFFLLFWLFLNSEFF